MIELAFHDGFWQEGVFLNDRVQRVGAKLSISTDLTLSFRDTMSCLRGVPLLALAASPIVNTLISWKPMTNQVYFEELIVELFLIISASKFLLP